MTVLADRMAKRIKRDLNIDVVARIDRKYPGHWQRMGGAVVWTMDEVVNNVFVVASQYPVTELLRAKKWEYLREGSMLLLFPDYSKELK